MTRSALGLADIFRALVDACLAGVPANTPVEVWFQDETRIGQKNPQVRVWARKGTRPRQPADQRPQSAYLFGAVAPERGTGAAVVMPKANTRAMQLHLEEISRRVAAGHHGVVVMDQASWHTTDKPRVPDNLSILLLPPRSPEINPIETLWEYLRQNYLSNRVFESSTEIVDACAGAWNALADTPGKMANITERSRAPVSL
jgi:hypothetical protein